MTCCKYHAGMLRHEITIERRTRAADGYGGFTETWTGSTVQAYVEPLGGGERWQAMRVSPEVRFRAIVRFRGDAYGAPYWSAHDRVTWRGRTFAVESVVDVESRSEWLEMMLVEGKAS